MSESLHWVMASSEVRRLDDGEGNTLDLVVYTECADGGKWRWAASVGSGEFRIAHGFGYPDPISARKAAEYWLSVTREQNAMRAALEAEAQS
jgi:hypothetical protein